MRNQFLLVCGIAMSTAFAAAPAAAQVSVTPIGVDFASTAYTFTFGQSTFTFTGTGDPFGPLAISTGGTGQVNSFFGSPTTNFADRGTVTFGPDMQYSSFSTPTPIRFSNGDNLIGLSATSGGDTFFGFAFTTNSVLNSIGFATAPGATVTATTAITAAVPEPATWAMMLIGFGAMGVSMRRRRRTQNQLQAA